MSIKLSEIKQNVSLELLARQMVEGFITGLHKSPYHGFSVEFAEHRLYNDGESTRHIDWRVYSRTDKLFTKRYEEETNLRCLIALDVSPSMFYPAESKSKIRFSIYAAAALAYLLNKQRDAVGLCLFSNKIDTMTQVKSSATHLNKILTLLNDVAENSKKDGVTRVGPVLHEIAESIHKRSLVILFSDMFEGADDVEDVFKALQHLKHNRHEVIVFHVTDRDTELQFEFEDRPMEFIDLETADKIKLNPGDVKAFYRSQASSFTTQLKLRCNQYKIDFIEADVKTDFNQILQTYLIKRARMR